MISDRDIRIGQACLGLVGLFPEWDLAVCDRVAAALIDEYDRSDFAEAVQADLDRLPVVA